MTKLRPYYSVRTGKSPGKARLDFAQMRKIFFSIYESFNSKDFFQEQFGYYCVDAGDIAGAAGTDVGAFFLRRLRKDHLWPIFSKWEEYSEEDLFDVIELLFDCVSQPLEKDAFHHSFSNCGWHYKFFTKEPGQQQFRLEMNELLADYADGYELSDKGEILSLADPGLEPLFDESLPRIDPENVERRVEVAKLKFRRYRASVDERREAVRLLADVLEFLRPKLKSVLQSKDEADLFNIANNFAIRHHNVDQKNQYDQTIWLTWIFYFYLSTIQAAVQLIKKQEQLEI